MNHSKNSLSTLTAVATVIGLAACGSSQKSQSNTPSSAEMSQSGSDRYGSTMGQSAGAAYDNAMMGDGGGTQPSGLGGGTESYGSQGTVGSGTSPGAMSGSYGTGVPGTNRSGAGGDSGNHPGGAYGTSGMQESTALPPGGSTGTTTPRTARRTCPA
jgi:hypothetical protein